MSKLLVFPSLLLAACTAPTAHVAQTGSAPLLTSSDPGCEEVKMSAALDDGDGTLTSVPATCVAMLSAHDTVLADFLAGDNGDGRKSQLGTAMASALSGTLNSAADDLGWPVSMDISDACGAFSTASPPSPSSPPPEVPIIGDEPDGVIICESLGVVAGFTCGNTDASELMNAATDEALGADSPGVNWMTIDFDASAASHEASDIWLAVAKSLYMDQAAAVVLAWEDSQGVGAASILAIDFEVHGMASARGDFLDQLHLREPMDPAVYNAVDLVMPTRVVYRQDHEIRVWNAAGTGDSPKVRLPAGGLATSTAANPWAFDDVVAIVDPDRLVPGDVPALDIEDRTETADAMMGMLQLAHDDDFDITASESCP